MTYVQFLEARRAEVGPGQHMEQRDEPTLEFPYGFDEGIAFEAEELGVYYYAVVELPGGDRVRVSFYDAFRVAQDLEREQGREGSCVALPGMIVIPKVTRQYMESAVRELASGDYFRRSQKAAARRAWRQAGGGCAACS